MAHIQLIITMIVDDTPSETITLVTDTDSVDDGMQWLSGKFSELSVIALGV